MEIIYKVMKSINIKTGRVRARPMIVTSYISWISSNKILQIYRNKIADSLLNVTCKVSHGKFNR